MMSEFLLAYATLIALKNNIAPDLYEIDDKYVDEFHTALEQAQASLGKETFEAKKFWINDKFLSPRMTGGNYVTQQWNYSKEKYCDVRLLLTKLDAALNYLEMLAPKEDKQKIIGFRG